MKSQLLQKLSFQIYIILYGVLFSLAISAFTLFRPFTYIDNDHSYILCKTDQVRYELGPNFIFAIIDQLDPFNDKKARKLCQHKIIRDYVDSYPTPLEQNYTLLPTKLQESSWFNALFASFLAFSFGTVLIEFLRILLIKDSPSFGRYLWEIFLYLIE